MAASATLALKAGVWFRRGLLLIVSPVRGHHRRSQAETPLIDLFKFASPALNPGSHRWDCQDSVLPERRLRYQLNKRHMQSPPAERNAAFIPPMSLFLA